MFHSLRDHASGNDGFEREIFSSRHYVPEPPPTPLQMFSAIAAVLAVALLVSLIPAMFVLVAT